MADIKVFNKWSTDDIVIKDQGLVRYINLSPVIVPKTGGKNTGTRFHKSKAFIVERLINKVMVPGHKSKKHFQSSGRITGKAQNAYNVIKKTLEIIEEKTKQNPISVFVKALENAAAREEIITIEYGGARYPKAVESAPQRRVDVALRYMTQGAYHKSFNSKKAIEDTLSEEIMNAFKLSPNSFAISKKLEVERQADSSR